MARTKRVAAAKKVEPKSHNNNGKIAEIILENIDQQEHEIMEKIDKLLESKLTDLHIHFSTLKKNFPSGMLDMTIEEIKNGDMLIDASNGPLSLTKSILSNITNICNSTKSSVNSTKSDTKNSDMNKTRIIRSSRSRTKRSISVGCDDEGYTTAESSRATNSGGPLNKRQSRSKIKTALKPASRSLSRTNTGNTFTTPLNKPLPPNSTGTITPKCKPNTPLLYVRRPKMGEMAWSNQGSPILVSGIIAPERTANVNIPVGDNILSLLPTRGAMRQSQIPDMDEDTTKQLQILRDNLIKVCDTLNISRH